MNNSPEEIAAIIEWMLAEGYLEVHPDDLERPEGERRLRKTAKGEEHQVAIEKRLGQMRNASLS